MAPGSIVLHKFSAFWNQAADPVLENLNFKFEAGKFYGVTGKIGSGKSSLLQTFIREMPFVKGGMWVSGSISYVEQEPVIFSESIRSNVVFGAEFNEKKYWTALKKSCLVDDLKLLEAGDETLIGERAPTYQVARKRDWL